MHLRDFHKIESSRIEFKEKLEIDKPKSWLKSVSAFANSKGGTLLFGVRDETKEAIGLDNIVHDSEKISEIINRKIVPLPRYEIDMFSENSKDFLVLNIGDGPRTPYYYESDGRKEAYIRAGNESILAPKHILENLILKGQNTTFDELPSKYNINDVSFTLFSATFKNKTNSELEMPKDYVSLNLLINNNIVTNAGLLLSDQGLIEQSKIFCTRWNGLKKSSLETDALDDKEYYGSIISLLENAELFIRNNSKLNWKIEGLERIEKEDYPRDAVREALVNAIIHRDYQIKGSEIHIDMFDDRLEITSPGGMVDGSIIQKLDINTVASIRRNRIISDIFNRLNFMERRGSGLIRIIDSYQDTKEKPRFYSDNSTFKVIFPNKNYLSLNTEMDIGNAINDKDYFYLQLHRRMPKSTRSKTFDQLEKLFEEFTYSKDFKREDISEVLNIQKSRASEIISILLEKELIFSSGPAMYKFRK